MSPRNRREKIIRIQKKVTTVGASEAKIIFTKAPFIQYEQNLLYKNFRQYLEMIIVSKKKNVTHGGSEHSNTKNI